MNINATVKVKLTDIGISELKRQHDELNEVLNNRLGEFRIPSKDADGYSTFQLWSLMNSFGHMMQMGYELPFEPDIKL